MCFIERLFNKTFLLRITVAVFKDFIFVDCGFIYRYTKTVVAAGPSMQRYNPELKLSANFDNGDPRIANLADKLRQVHHVSNYQHIFGNRC